MPRKRKRGAGISRTSSGGKSKQGASSHLHRTAALFIPPQPDNVGDITEEPISPSAPNNKQVKISNLKRANKRQNKTIKGLTAGKKEAEQRLSSSETNTRQIKKDANKKVSALEKKLESSVQQEHKTAISGEKYQ